MGYIYRINNINGKTYIGCSENYKRRWKEHIATLERNGEKKHSKHSIVS
jgi:predicted GIY-YIG superfamily endonuclease